MLKWAVNGPRQTYLQTKDDNDVEFPVTSGSSSQLQRKHLKRKSSDMSSPRPKTYRLDKENQFTSTPLHTSNTRFSESASSKRDSLKDLSNIVPELTCDSPLRLASNKESSKILRTESTQDGKNFPNNYASTLPTFDVEYSPNALISGPMLALRGVGIPDSYFEKPRYITPHLKGGLCNVNEELSLEIKPLQQAVKPILKYPAYIEESTLSSTKMGDATLERMIDAILESNHKESKPSKSQKNLQSQQPNMSPTYTPAEDPASDLHEVWDSEKARYRQKEHKFRSRLTKKSLCNEREICSPLLQENFDPGQLRRQRGLRRKRKINQIRASVVNSAQKLLEKGAQSENFYTHSLNLSKECDAELIHNGMHPRELSPDSGHNSSSDYEEDETDRTLEYMTHGNKTLDNTKRRLSFSSQTLNEI